MDHAFRRRYTKADIGLLAEADEALGQLAGTPRAVMRWMYEEYGDERFERLAGISNGQFYNLRKSTSYRRRRTTFRETRATAVSIGERRKPRPKGRPGFLRVDTVHQGDKDGEKGAYHVNLVDEVTQWEHVATVRAISERCLVPVLEELIKACPFKVLGFHADNGSEYINQKVVESKNGNVIRRCFGYGHIPKLFAPEVNAFARDTLSPFLNFHRPCLFASEVTDTKGKTRKCYRYKDVMTPFEKLRSLPKVEHYLKPGVTIAALEDQAGTMGDLEAAVDLKRARANSSPGTPIQRDAGAPEPTATPMPSIATAASSMTRRHATRTPTPCPARYARAADGTEPSAASRNQP